MKNVSHSILKHDGRILHVNYQFRCSCDLEQIQINNGKPDQSLR